MHSPHKPAQLRVLILVVGVGQCHVVQLQDCTLHGACLHPGGLTLKGQHPVMGVLPAGQLLAGHQVVLVKSPFYNVFA